MKTLAELKEIKDRMKEKVVLREGKKNIRAVVGMATCGIAAGARDVLIALAEEVNNAGLSHTVTVMQTGCNGNCEYEPIVEVFEDGKGKTTYVKVDAEKARKIVEQHLKGGKAVEEYTLENYKA